MILLFDQINITILFYLYIVSTTVNTLLIYLNLSIINHTQGTI